MRPSAMVASPRRGEGADELEIGLVRFGAWAGVARERAGDEVGTGRGGSPAFLDRRAVGERQAAAGVDAGDGVGDREDALAVRGVERDDGGTGGGEGVDLLLARA